MWHLSDARTKLKEGIASILELWNHDKKSQRTAVLLTETKVDSNETISYSLKRYLDKKITIPSEIEKFSKEMDEAFYTENKKRYPEHVHSLA